MLTPTLRISPRLLTVSTRTFCSAPVARFPHRKEHQNAEEQKEQKLFDQNKSKLDNLEHEHGVKNTDTESCEELKKKGEDAQVEQNRPDDGVY